MNNYQFTYIANAFQARAHSLASQAQGAGRTRKGQEFALAASVLREIANVYRQLAAEQLAGVQIKEELAAGETARRD